MSDEDILKAPESKGELEAEVAKLQEEMRDSHAILDRLGSDSRNVKPDATKEVELRLPARINRFVAESQGAILKLLSQSGGFRG